MAFGPNFGVNTYVESLPKIKNKREKKKKEGWGGERKEADKG